MFINQKSLVEYYKLLGFKIADEDHKAIVDLGHYKLSQPMTSTIGEIKKAIETYENDNKVGRRSGDKRSLGGKSKSKRNKSTRRRVFRKSRRQIKKRN
jgi:hypothetical protein